MEKQKYIDVIDSGTMLSLVSHYYRDGYRLAAITATQTGGKIQILYSFSRDNLLSNLRLSVYPVEEVESIGKIYPYAFLYENEIAELFGINIVNMPIDYEGDLYQIAVKKPFNE